MDSSFRPILSIVTVTYNDPDGLKKTLESLRPLLRSGSPGWEHIVVDSSPLENKVAMDSWRLANVSHLERKPTGIYPAMNEGLAHASGRYIWFLNGGDSLKAPGALWAATAWLDTHPDHDAISLAVDLFREQEFQYRKPGGAGFFALVGKNRVCHQSLVYRTNAFGADAVGLYSEKYRLASDYEHHLRMLARNAKIGVLPEVLAEYDMGGQSGNFRKVMGEIAEIHRSLRPEMAGAHWIFHEAVRKFEWVRLLVIEKVVSTEVGVSLRNFWMRCKRLRG